MSCLGSYSRKFTHHVALLDADALDPNSLIAGMLEFQGMATRIDVQTAGFVCFACSFIVLTTSCLLLSTIGGWRRARGHFANEPNGGGITNATDIEHQLPVMIHNHYHNLWTVVRSTRRLRIALLTCDLSPSADLRNHQTCRRGVEHPCRHCSPSGLDGLVSHLSHDIQYPLTCLLFCRSAIVFFVFLVLFIWNIDGVTTAPPAASVLSCVALPMNVVIDSTSTPLFVPRLAATIVLAVGAIYITLIMLVLKSRA